MNQDNDQYKSTEIDAQVSEQYSSIAGEETPPHLDQAVLREAKRAVRADNRKDSFGAWFRPVAFVATVGLSLAIILELSDSGIFGAATDLPIEIAPKAETPAGSSADRANGAPSQPALSEIKRQEKLAPADSPTPDYASGDAAIAPPAEPAAEPRQADQGQLRKMRVEMPPADTPAPAAMFEDQAEVSEAFTSEAASVRQRVQQIEKNLAVEVAPQAAPGTRAAAPEADNAFALFSQSPHPGCSDQQKSSSEEWWKCVASLRDAGHTDLADLETANLRKSFPDFELPE